MPLNHGWVYREQVGPAAGGQSLHAYLARRYRHSSAEVWGKRLAAGEVELGGRVAGGDERLTPGQSIAWHRPPWNEPDVPTDFAVLFEDEALVGVGKPAGLPTMPAGGFVEQTLLQVVRARWPEAAALHRLGRHTSGVVLFARTTEAASHMSAAWRRHEIRKCYRTLVAGTPAWVSCDIREPIGPVPHPLLGTVFGASPDGKPAHSIAVVVASRGQDALVDVEIATGRPHQIRIHLAAVGHPLAGDPLYAAGGRPRLPDPGLPGDGGYLLHARRLEFAHPVTTRPVVIEAAMPAELASLT